jgi:hypothetical protein
MSKSYTVQIPFAGYISVDIDADSAKNARDGVLANIREGADGYVFSLKNVESGHKLSIDECDFYEILSEGNVENYSLNEITVLNEDGDEVDPDDEDDEDDKDNDDTGAEGDSDSAAESEDGA